MALRGYDIAALLSPSPRNPLAGTEALLGGITRGMEEKRRRKEYEDKMAITRGEMQSREAKRMADIQNAKTKASIDLFEAMAKEKRMGKELALRERQQQGVAIKGLEELMAQGTERTKAYLSSQGMLAPEQRGPLGPDTESVLADIGLAGPQKPIGIMAGGRQFDLSPEGTLAQRSSEVQNLFAKSLAAVPEEYVATAQAISEMAPEAVEAMSGNKEKAVEFLENKYKSVVEQEQKTKKRRMGVYKKASGFDENKYLRGITTHKGILKDNEYYANMETLRKMNDAYRLVSEGDKKKNGEMVWTGIRFMLRLQGEGSHASDLDVERAEGLKSAAQIIKDEIAAQVYGTRSQKTVENIKNTITYAMGLKHSVLRGIYNQLMNTYRITKTVNERAALDTLIESSFNMPYFSWYKPTGFELDAKATSQEERSAGVSGKKSSAMSELESMVEELEPLTGGGSE